MVSDESDARGEEPGTESGAPGARWDGSADRHGQVNQAGQNQYITHNYYLAGGPPADDADTGTGSSSGAETAAGAGTGTAVGTDAVSGAGTEPGAETGGDAAAGSLDGSADVLEPAEEGTAGGRFAGYRAAWISAAATVAAALIAALATSMTDGAGDARGDGSPRATSSGSGATPVPDVEHAEEESPSPSKSPREPDGSEHWKGKLVLYSRDTPGDKDLDAPEPVGTGSTDYNDFYIDSFLGNYTLDTHRGREVVRWEGKNMPGYGECKKKLDVDAVRRLDLVKGQVVCARTGAGRIARLTVTNLPKSEGVEPRVRFDAVVWNSTPETVSPRAG